MSFDNIWTNILQLKELIAISATLVTSAYGIYRYGRTQAGKPYRQEILQLKDEIETLKGVIAKRETALGDLGGRLDQIDAVITSKDDFWARKPTPPFDLVSHRDALKLSIPIISVVNFKGGVGKTTICANLAGYFAHSGKRVLLIDFDYQGSLSNTVLTHARIGEFKATSHKLIEGVESPGSLRDKAIWLTSLSSNLWIYPAFYEFSRSEIQVMFRWLVGRDQDARFNLHRYLACEAFQSDPDCRFDLILIDCPPRFLTGSVNALAASTHVLVPTILDGQSHEATLNTLEVIQRFRQNLNLGLRTIGVVPSMVATSTGYNAREGEVIEKLERQIAQFHDLTPILKDQPIMRKEELARSGGSEVVFFGDGNGQDLRTVRALGPSHRAKSSLGSDADGAGARSTGCP